MSRTDKTDPHWVRAIWWEPHHHRCPHGVFPGARACDLPPEPIVDATHSRRWFTRGQCLWTPSWEGMRELQGRGYGAPTWYVRLRYTGPQRRRVRDQLVRARQEYRATGTVDVIAETDPHRNAARWTWW